ncbi:MAG: DNA repair protein RecN [Lachnospiraceae bacterium]|nr:DNA repair protein RecN [Lachnospiraceae bacterium]MBQ6195802.1 DNA repair protein RecN [Lachnospiraceae bacterium]
MLRNLHVKNFALIDDAAVEFKSGLNVLTGETGAGKSILIDALGSALGQRAGSEVIRRGAESAYTELVFSTDDISAEKLAELELEPEDGQLIISRRILPGRNTYKINDETVTASRVRAVTECLLDIHGQHEHQSLLKTSKQLEILDSFAGNEASVLKSRCGEAYRAYKKAEEELASFTLSEEERLRRADFLDFEIGEIENAAIKPGEKDSLSDEFKRLSHGEKIERAVGSALAEISDNASDALNRASGQLSSVTGFDPSLMSLSEQLLTIEDLIDSLRRDAEAYLQDNPYDEQRLNSVADRLDEIHRLENKYGDLSGRGEEILAKRREERRKLKEYEELRAEALKARETAFNALTEACSKLTSLRRSVIPPLTEAITAALQELNFLSVRFLIELKQTDMPSASGSDSVQFLISLNPGAEPEPLARVASGGELSRIMLAIKTILADQDDIPTVIFDEIDTGISGRTAQMVGRKLKEISRYRQVILITHLPQIAAMADAHFGIEKWTDNVRTYTGVRLLNEEESVRELARLLGGDQISESVLITARELKNH